MKRSREFFLWAFFLALCFWAGYLKGFLPSTLKQGLFLKDPIRIYNAAPFEFPRAFITNLEEELGQEVQIIRIRNWDELQAKMVTKSGAHLLFAPAHWAPDLSREGLIVGLSYIQPKIEKYISSDFISLHGKSPQVLPLYWTLTKFKVPEADFPELNQLEQVLQDKRLAEVHLYPDLDLMATHVNQWNLKIKDIEGFAFKNPPVALPKNSLWEVPHLVNIPNSKELQTEKHQALLLYGMMIPRNAANRRLSYKALEKLIEPITQQPALSVLALGTTLKDSHNELQIEKEQRSSELRNLRLHELILLDGRKLKDIQRLQQHYNFIF